MEEGLSELTMLLMADDHDSFSTCTFSSLSRWLVESRCSCCCCAESCIWQLLLSGPFADTHNCRGVITRQHLGESLCRWITLRGTLLPLLSVATAIYITRLMTSEALRLEVAPLELTLTIVDAKPLLSRLHGHEALYALLAQHCPSIEAYKLIAN